MSWKRKFNKIRSDLWCFITCSSNWRRLWKRGILSPRWQFWQICSQTNYLLGITWHRIFCNLWVIFKVNSVILRTLFNQLLYRISVSIWIFSDHQDLRMHVKPSAAKLNPKLQEHTTTPVASLQIWSQPPLFTEQLISIGRNQIIKFVFKLFYSVWIHLSRYLSQLKKRDKDTHL